MDKINYLNAITQAKIMLSKGLITIKDFLKIESKIAKKYGLKKTNLCRANELI